MPIIEPKSPASPPLSIGAAEAIYVLFRSLPKQEKLALAKYILEDEEVRTNMEGTRIPNASTLKSFREEKSEMPVFHSVETLRKDFLS
jgi:hypothetical protein